MTTFHAVFDTRFWGASFDFVVFIGVVEIIRRLSRPQSTGIQLTIITGATRRDEASDFKGVSFQERYENPADYNRQRVHDILLPCANLAPCIKSVSVLNDPGDSHIERLLQDVSYPPNINWSEPDPQALLAHYPQPARLYASAGIDDIRILQNSPASLRAASGYARRLIGTDSPIVFTVRNHGFGTDRSRDNGRRFMEIARSISHVHPVVVVPDTADVPRGISTDLPVAYEASLNIHLRAALYENAAANFIGNNGPALLLNMNKNATYHQSGLVSERWPIEAFDAHWSMAKKILERIGGDGSYVKRLEANRSGPNFFAHQAEHQVCDYQPLTLDKAQQFLANVGIA